MNGLFALFFGQINFLFNKKHYRNLKRQLIYNTIMQKINP